MFLIKNIYTYTRTHTHTYTQPGRQRVPLWIVGLSETEWEVRVSMYDYRRARGVEEIDTKIRSERENEVGVEGGRRGGEVVVATVRVQVLV